MPTLRMTATGSAGSLTCTFDLGRGVYRIEHATGGFGTSEWGNIKFVLAHRETPARDEYFHSGVSVPAPGGAHASIVTYEGNKRIDGKDYLLKIIGVANVTDSLYGHVDYREEKEE